MAQNFRSIENNQEKYQVYKIQIERFKKAKEQGFYFEGIFILYAMLEDRLSAFLYHAGALNNQRQKLTTNKEVKPHLEAILESLGHRKYRISNVSNKILILKQILLYLQTHTNIDGSGHYPTVLYSQFLKLKRIDEIVPLLDLIREWCTSRNELVHALLIKNPDQQEEKLVMLNEDGYQYCRQLDNFIKTFKTGNTIRKQFNIQ